MVIGGDGLVGRQLCADLRRRGEDFVATTRQRETSGLFCDLADLDLVPFKARRFSRAYFCAAATDMAWCEAHARESDRINVTGTLALLRHLGEKGCHTVFFSSSQVFDGETPLPDEDSFLNPLNRYGRQKASVETVIAAEGLPVAILRIAKVLAPTPVGMFRKWFAELSEGHGVRAASNLSLAPVKVSDVSQAALCLGLTEAQGIWHYCSSDEMTYLEAVRLMARLCGFPEEKVEGEVLTEERVPRIFRHRYTAMRAQKVAEAFRLPIHPAHTLLEEIFAAFPSAPRMPGWGRGR